MLKIANPLIEIEEIKAVNEVLRSGIIAQGPKVAELEKNFAEYCGTKYAVAVSSGTAAIHAALFAAGVGPGDEVITVAFSFIATVNPIIMLGATPILVDIEEDTFNIDTAKLESVVTSKTKAIIPVHLYGQPANMDHINAFAKKHNIYVIEDACQAVGAEYRGVKSGNLGDMGCFSLYATKNIMCGEGGVVTTDNIDFVDKIRQFRQHGMSGPYQYVGLGYNYRMTDLQAAIAVEQLKKVDKFNNKRIKNANIITQGIQGLLNIKVPYEDKDRTHVYHQYTIRVSEDRRDYIVDALSENGINAGVYYPMPLHVVPHIMKYGYKEGDFEVSEKVSRSVISLPIHPALSKSDLEKIINCIKEVLV